MQVTDLDIVILRAQIAGEEEVTRRAVADQMTATGSLSGLAALAHSAFVIAARWRFAPTWARGEVIQYIAQVRGLLADRPGLLDPATAEDELRRALGDEVEASHEIGAIAAARIFLLIALAESLDLDDDVIFDLLYQARDMADEMLASVSGTDGDRLP
jgi:hypothetical protein